MSLLPPLGLPAASPPGPVSAVFKPALGSDAVSGTASPSGRVAGSDIVTQPAREEQADPVTPSRIMLEVRRAVEADMQARSQTDTADHGLSKQDASLRYAAARQALPV